MPTKRQIAEKAREAVAGLLEEEAQKLEEPRQYKPGEYNPHTKGKTPWTMKNLEEAYGIVEFTPDETIPVTVSGIKLMLLDGVTMTAPKCFQDIWLKSREARKGRNTAKTLLRLGIFKEDYPGQL